MYKRSAEKTAEDSLSFFPVIAILGPRQCGKTTLAKMLMNNRDAIYLDMESLADQRKLTDPELYLDTHAGKLIVIDEVQQKPELFPILRSFVDRTESKSPIIVLGSASQELLRQGGETLAGRVALIELSPLTVMEVTDKPVLSLWLRGGFPDSVRAPQESFSIQWRDNYIRTFIERDLPQLGLNLPLVSLQRLLLILAHNHGTTLNFSKTGELFGVSHTQMRKYIDFLQGAFLVRTVPPCEPNVKKQIVKTPRIYYRDSGILHTVLGIDSFDTLLGHTITGESWEGFAIEQILASISSRWRYSFYRTHKGTELDFILEFGTAKIGIEFKSHTAPTVTKGFWEALNDLEIEPSHAWIVCPIEESYPYKNGVTIGGVREVITYIQSFEKQW